MADTKRLQDKLGQAIRAVAEAKAEVQRIPEPARSSDYSIKLAWERIKQAEDVLIAAENAALSADDED